jgi:hypothetical protein
MGGIIHSVISKTDTYKELMGAAKELNGSFVKAGFPEKADVGEPNRNGSDHKPYADMSEVARVAVWNEYGATIEHEGGTAYRTAYSGGKGMTRFIKNSDANVFDIRTSAHTISIPSRPFFRNWIDGKREKIIEMAQKFADLALIGKTTVDQAFENLGLFCQAGIRQSIRSTLTPPNSRRTIKAKGSSHPLIDSGQMINSVTFAKEKKAA